MSLRLKSMLGYGGAMVLACAWLLAAAPELRNSGVVWAACMTTSLSAPVFGWIFGAWYVPTADEQPGFELWVCPVLVLLLSLFAGLLATGLGTLFLEPQPQQAGSLVMGLASFFFFASAAFISKTWPVLLPGYILVAWFLARAGKRKAAASTPVTLQH